MSELIVFLSLVFTSGIGCIIISFFNLLPKSNPESFFYSYGLGVGLIAFQMFAYSILGIKWSLSSISALWFFLGVAFFILKPDLVKSKVKLKLAFSKIDKLLLLLITVLLIYVGFESILRPLMAWDGWASWLLKAKMFYIDGFLNPRIFEYVPSEYPLVISLFSTFIYVILGGINDRVVLLVFFMFYLVLGGVFFFSLRELIGNTKALIFTFLLLSLQDLIRHGGRFDVGQADLALGYYFFASSMLLFKYIKNKSNGILVLLNIFLGITANIKNEGILFTFVIEVIIWYLCIKSKKYIYLLLSLFWVLPILSWQLFKYIYNIPKVPSYIQPYIHLDRFPIIILEIMKEFLNLKNWNLLWILLILTLILLKFKRNQWLLIYILIFVQLTIYSFVFLVTPVNPVLHIRNTIDRLLIHLVPMAAFSIAIVFSDIKNNILIPKKFKNLIFLIKTYLSKTKFE